MWWQKRLMGFVCFAVVNPCVLSANRVYFGLFYLVSFPFYPPPPPVTHTIFVDFGFFVWFHKFCNFTPPQSDYSSTFTPLFLIEIFFVSLPHSALRIPLPRLHLLPSKIGNEGGSFKKGVAASVVKQYKR